MQQLTESFAYDPVGNRTSSHRATGQLTDAANRLLEDSQFVYTYDANGNLTAKTAKTTGVITTYTYDAENRLTQVQTPSVTAVYRYDALGRRITKEVTQGGTTTITRYVYDSEDILVELDGTNTVVARYTHGLGIDEPLAVFRGGQSFFSHADGLGSLTQLTDSTGTVAQSYTYDSFGTLLAQTGTVTQPYTYTGREVDPETGLYYYRARYYDPASGRFLQEDPIGFSGGVNFYSYVVENPVNYTDPLGLETYQCRRPLGGKPGDNQRSGPDIWGNPAYHQYTCTRAPNGQLVCGGQSYNNNRAWWPDWIRTPGRPTTPTEDYYDPKACNKSRDDNKCFEQCLIDEWQKPRPPYGIPYGTDCQEYDEDVNKRCRKKCGLK